MFQRKKMFQGLQMLAVPAVLSMLLTISPIQAQDAPSNPKDDTVTFNMVVSAGVRACLPDAAATVSIRPGGEVDFMDVTVRGLPPNTEFNVFVIQVPKSPFGVSWYQGSIQTDKHGRGSRQFVGRFNIETFTVANNSAPAPAVFSTDATVNPPFNPIQMYHLGVWFDSTQAAGNATCPSNPTPFNGEHNAGPQVFNTSNFADDHGPLRDVANPASEQ